MSTRSLISSVFSIEADGMKKAWIANDLMSRASTSATTTRTGSSRQKLRRRLPLPRVLPPLPLLPPLGSAAGSSVLSAPPPSGPAPPEPGAAAAGVPPPFWPGDGAEARDRLGVRQIGDGVGRPPRRRTRTIAVH